MQQPLLQSLLSIEHHQLPVAVGEALDADGSAAEWENGKRKDELAKHSITSIFISIIRIIPPRDRFNINLIYREIF